ncbi:uncharacterized protein YALI1_E24451g [Yarrowia lipolytica]|uniref:Uncharacterized protein n=1 Tax=Yarrowia lipolytica TaxID=4952 RepID=A0A1D8NJ95_YARLL|nr:hypothetical protein YALI1_E24451g [Yarrowia lipolytica]
MLAWSAALSRVFIRIEPYSSYESVDEWRLESIYLISRLQIRTAASIILPPAHPILCTWILRDMNMY